MNMHDSNPPNPQSTRFANINRIPGVTGLGLLAIVVLVVSALRAGEMRSSPAQDDREKGLALYNETVKELLVDNCYECHSSKDDRYESGLDLETREGMLEGGDRGAAIEPGEPEESLLITALSYEDEDLEMPPPGRLEDEEIEAFVEWIRLGAPMPDKR